jgi:hypothetical protein
VEKAEIKAIKKKKIEIQKALKHEDSRERRIQIRKEINQLIEEFQLPYGSDQRKAG